MLCCQDMLLDTDRYIRCDGMGNLGARNQIRPFVILSVMPFLETMNHPTMMEHAPIHQGHMRYHGSHLPTMLEGIQHDEVCQPDGFIQFVGRHVMNVNLPFSLTGGVFD